MKSILVAKNIIKEYGDNTAKFRALDDVSLEIKEGDFISIMGPSGSGKSTLLNILATIDICTKGKVIINNKDVRALKERELCEFRRNNIGFIFQDCNLLDTLTIRDNILAPLILLSVPKDECDKKVSDVAKRLEIEEILDKYPAECSGGQRQRAAACRALVTNPKMIVADEPTGALDTKNSNELLSILQTLNRESNITVVMVTHDSLIGSYANTLLFIKDGKIENTLDRDGLSQMEFYNQIVRETSRESNSIFNEENNTSENESNKIEKIMQENIRLKKMIKELEKKIS
ncbi:ABC transporter ATP-binding protein [Clostridium paraputrificum]|uniref:ABC transporter ATP-binding protein n=1 Tax=Clostridium TaxID=1485 RepID=UPI003D3415DA